MKILNELGKKMLFFDGGLGTMLQAKGAQPGEMTELWNIKRPEDVLDVHCQYLEAGADIITANTFGASNLKLEGSGYTSDEVIKAGIGLVKEAINRVCGCNRAGESGGRKAYAAMDISSTGKLRSTFTSRISTRPVRSGADSFCSFIYDRTPPV